MKKIRHLFSLLTPKRVFPFILIIFGILGMAASMTISIEKTDLLKNPTTELFCDLNPVYSCAKVIDSAQSHTLGLPNELIGIAMFSVLIAVGVATLAGAKLKKWFWCLFMLGMIGFMANVLRLFYVSVFQIEALCLLCSAVWFSGWAITTSGFAWMYDAGLFETKKRYGSTLKLIRRNIIGFWILLLIIMTFIVLNHFWYYYGQYFSL